jgi:zinc/manganese transport system permease protein
MIETVVEYLHYDFVQNALLAGTMAAILGAVVGYFVVIRSVSFAAHALSHIGFAGAAGAALLGLAPLQGMLLLTIGSGVFMGAIGDRVHRSDMAIGMVLSAALGLGVLFLSLYAGFAGQALAILFGDVFGVSAAQVDEMAILTALSLAGLALFSRRLLFASTQPRLAEARGLSVRGLSIAFMIVVAISVSLASQVVGILLVFTLIIAPAGIALRLCRSFWSGMALACGLGVAGVWAGLLLACVTNRPVTFWITFLFFVLYVGVEVYHRAARRA